MADAHFTPPTRDEIVHLLLTNNRAVERAILYLFSQQTHTEQVHEDAETDNARGFSQAHARKGCSFAKQIQRGFSLTERQLAWCRHEVNGRPRLAQYWKQLQHAARERHAERLAA